jgi:hypothetical protein
MKKRLTRLVVRPLPRVPVHNTCRDKSNCH